MDPDECGKKNRRRRRLDFSPYPHTRIQGKIGEYKKNRIERKKEKKRGKNIYKKKVSSPSFFAFYWLLLPLLLPRI